MSGVPDYTYPWEILGDLRYRMELWFVAVVVRDSGHMVCQRDDIMDSLALDTCGDGWEGVARADSRYAGSLEDRRVFEVNRAQNTTENLKVFEEYDGQNLQSGNHDMDFCTRSFTEFHLAYMLTDFRSFNICSTNALINWTLDYGSARGHCYRKTIPQQRCPSY